MRNVVLALLAFAVLPAYAQSFNIDVLSVGDGLPQSQVSALVEGPNGNVWIGTQGGGVARFNGLGFEVLGASEGLSDLFIQSLAIDGAGRLLIGTRTGLYRYNGLHVRRIRLGRLAEVSIRCLTSVSSGTWIGTDQGLFFLAEANIRSESVPWQSPLLVEDVAESVDGTLWVATNDGLYCRRGQSWNRYGTSNGLRSNLINRLHISSTGDLWVGLYGGGCMKYLNGQFISPDGLRSGVVLAVAKWREGTAVGTLNEGLKLVDEHGSLTQFSAQNGLPSNRISALLEDTWGNLWIGTSGGGVARYRGQAFQHLGRDQGLPGKQVYSISAGSDGVLCLGVSDRGLWRYSPDLQPHWQQDTVIRQGKVKCLLHDTQGNLLAGTEGSGLLVYSPDTVVRVDRDHGMLSPFITALAERSDGTWVVGTAGGGIHQIQGSAKGGFSVKPITRGQGLQDDRITSVAVDAFDRAWFGTRSSGLGVLMGEEIIGFGSEQGLVSDAVRCLHLDAFHHLWIGTEDAGLAVIDLAADTLSIASARFNEQLASQNVYALITDAAGDLWVGTESGVDRVMLNDARELVDVRHFAGNGGFLGIELCTNAAFRDPRDGLWFGTIDGMNFTFPNDIRSNPNPPILAIEEIRLFYTPLSDTHLRTFLGDWGMPNEAVVLTYGQNNLGFSFTGVHQFNPRGVKYRWRLLGLEEAWSPLSQERSISYSNLPAGDYTFQVEAVGENGIWTPAPEEISFRILRPYWQEFWFKVGLWAFLLALIALLVWLRVRRVQRKAKERTDRLKLENAVLGLEQKALRLQMNPHFIFNTLNSIQGLIARKDEKTARLYLSKFSRLMRTTLENSREEMVTLQAELEALEYFLTLEAFTHDDRFTWHIEPNNVDTEAWMVPPLLIQPFAENAIIHGLLPRESPGTLTISLHELPDRLEIHVVDNGIGRKAAAERNKSRKGHRSTGLQVTRERLELLKRNGETWESIRIEDLEEGGRVLGTRVVMNVGI